MKCRVAALALVLVLYAFAVEAGSSGPDERECESATNFYRELQCVGIDKSVCPGTYSCPDLEKLDANKCYHRSNSFSVGDKISDEETIKTNPCAVSCICQQDRKNVSFSCAAIDCPETLTGEDIAEGCILVHKDLLSCCAEKKICDKQEIDELTKCKVDGKVVREGQLFYPGGCKECICSQGFDSQSLSSYISSQNCKRTGCGLELFYQKEVRGHCAPVFYDKGSACCPIDWLCPSAEHTVVKTKVGANATDRKCRFGADLMSVGDTITSDDKCVTCKCSTPPVPMCVRQSNCSRS